MSSNIRKFRICAVCLSLLFVLTTAFGLLALSLKGAYAADGRAAALQGELKFKQIAVGEDFAIALTYDNDLYAWSLLDTAVEKGLNGTVTERVENNITTINVTPNTGVDTLGKFYPKNPVKLDVYLTGVRTGSTVVSGLPKPSNLGSDTYIGENDKIKQIAATRKTAAFLTEKGLIYTWGYESSEPSANATSTDLLLRPRTAETAYPAANHYLIPSVINYGGTFNSVKISNMLPIGKNGTDGASNSSDDIAEFELSSSEYNYSLYHKRWSHSESSGWSLVNSNFIWGQNAYGQRYNSDSNVYALNKNEQSDYWVANGDNSVLSQVYLGDGNVYYINNNSLQVRGKNYVVPTSEILKANLSGDATVLNGIANPFGSVGAVGYTMVKTGAEFLGSGFGAPLDTGAMGTLDGNSYVEIPNAVMKFTSLGALTLQANAVTAELKDSNGNKRADVKLSQFSAANGYGYAINSDGKLVFWGDNRLQQGTGNLTDQIVTLKNVSENTGFKQVVAGKVLSGDSIIEGINTPIVAGSDTKWFDDYNLAAKYVDGSTLISATLSSSGINVFGAYNGDKFDTTKVDDLLKAKGVSVGGANSIAALFGGYGNNLFVLSTLGKIYRVRFDESAIKDAESDGTYNSANLADYLVCEQYDKFYVTVYNSDGTNTGYSETVNWSVGSEASKITFNKDYLDSSNNSLVSAVVGLDVDGGSALNANNSLIKPQVPEGSESLVAVSPKYAVTNNNSGDAYRMILPLAQYTDIGNSENLNIPSSLKDIDASYSGLINTPSGVNGWNLEFYWKEGTKTYAEPIPQDVAFRYFKIEYRYANDRVEFVLTPKRSTAGKSIVIKYWVGRYDADLNASLVTSAEANPAFMFYDFKQASLEVEIADTQFAKNYTLRVDNNDENSNSSVPLLDPNNPFNKHYSIAAMNVSEGFNKLIESLAAEFNVTSENIVGTANDANMGSVKRKLLELVGEQDAGFPALSKVSDGSLDYYGVKGYYDNLYRFFATDHDGDIIEFESVSTIGSDYKEYFDFATRKITVVLPFSEFGASVSVDEAKLKNLFEKTEANGNVLRFDNKYGLTLRIIKTTTDSGDAFSMEISYEVLTVTAKKSMTDTYVTYTEKAAGSYDISAPKTLIDTGSPMNLLRPVMGKRNASGEFSDTVMFENSNADLRGVEVFTQSSLTFKERSSADAGAIYNPVDKHEIFGSASAGKNVYTMKTVPLALGISNTGIGGGQYRIYLGDFFDDYENLRFSYKGDPDALDDLKATFGPGLNAVEITDIGEESGRGQYIEIKPYREVAGAQFTFEVRRIMSGSSTFADMNETAYINFTVAATFGKSDLFSKVAGAPDKYNINGSEEIKIRDRMQTTEEFLTRTGMCTVEVESNDETVVTVKRSDDKLKFVLTGKSSGNAIVTYKVKLFGRNEYVFTDSFEVQVTTQAAMDVPYQVIDRTKIYFSELENYVKRMNELGDVSLSLKEDKPFRTEQTDGDASLPDSELEWYEVENIKFLKTPEIDSSKQFLLLAMGDFDSSETPPTSRVVVTFVDKDGNEYDVAFRVSPAAMSVKDKLAGKTFTFDINKANGTIAVYGRESGDGVEEAKKLYAEPYENGKFSIGVEFFKSVMEWPETKRHVIVAAQTDGSKYIEVTTSSPEDATAILITPLYPTTEDLVDGCTVQVSLRETTDNTVTLLSFYVRVSGIKIVLEKEEYRTVILAVFFSVLGLLVIIFFIRMGVYWKKKADQRKIIKKNQTLIKMREKMHNKTEAVNKRNVVRTKLKMEDPKYARMFDQMRREKEAQSGIALDNSLVAQKVDKKVKAEKAAKKKKKKGSLDELQAQIAAKREAMERMQAGDFSAMPEGMATVVDVPPMDGVVVEQPVSEEMPVFNTADLDSMTAEQLDEQLRATLGDDPIIFEAVEPDQNGGNQ